jgi:hypothetical protein
MQNKKVQILKTGQTKYISEIENINGVDILYMTDKTSYSETEILMVEVEPILINQESFSDALIDTICNSKRNYDAGMKMMSDLMSNNKKNNVSIKKTKTIKLFGWTITFSKSN